MAARYWVGNGGNWSDDDNHWATVSGGAPANGNLPVSTDDVYFDANSFSSSSQKVIVDTAAQCQNMDWTGVINSPILSGSNNNYLQIYGNLTFVAGMSITGEGAPIFSVDFKATTSGKTITMNGQQWPSVWLGNIDFSGVGGEWTLQDNFNCDLVPLRLTAGTLLTNGKTVTTKTLSTPGTSTKVLTLGSSTINILNWDFSSTTNLTFNPNTSTIIVGGGGLVGGPNTFQGGGFTYNNLTFSGNATPCTISGSNTFNNLTLQVNSVNKRILFTAGTTQTMTAFSATGEAGKIITMVSTVAGSPFTLSQASGISNSTYLFLQDSAATGGATFNVSNSIDNGGNSGWNFSNILNTSIFLINFLDQ